MIFSATSLTEIYPYKARYQDDMMSLPSEQVWQTDKQADRCWDIAPLEKSHLSIFHDEWIMWQDMKKLENLLSVVYISNFYHLSWMQGK